MQWLFRWSVADLAKWEQRPFSIDSEKGPRPSDNRDNHEREVASEDPGPPGQVARRLADAILRYDVFSPSAVVAVMRRTPVEIGDTIGVRFHFVPGLDLFFAARVTNRFESQDEHKWRCGFTYRTLDGHPECGEEDFIVEKDLASGKITVALRCWSRPEIWIARLVSPITRRLQLRAARGALDHLQQIAAGIGDGQTSAEPLTPHGSAGASPSRNLRTGLLRSNERW